MSVAAQQVALCSSSPSTGTRQLQVGHLGAKVYTLMQFPEATQQKSLFDFIALFS